MVVTQGYGQFGPGLIFKLDQDQSSCYDCGLNGLWDYDTCSCKCLTRCGCARPQIWMDYPACSCRCPIRDITVNDKEKKNYEKLLGVFRGKVMDVSDSDCG